MDDKENIEMIKQALKDYENGALIEAKEALAIVINRIEQWEIAESLLN